MPLYEHQAVTVRLAVEVDGHILTFEEAGKATGGRYQGDDPGNFSGSCLERNIRDTVDTCVARASRRVETFLARAYPVHSEPSVSVRTGEQDDHGERETT